MGSAALAMAGRLRGSPSLGEPGSLSRAYDPLMVPAESTGLSARHRTVMPADPRDRGLGIPLAT